MTTILETACLSAHVYTPSNQRALAFSVLPLTPKHLQHHASRPQWFFLSNIDSNMTVENNSFCQLYIKFHHQNATDAVIAIRGSFHYHDFMTDYHDWVFDALGQGCHDYIPAPYYAQSLAYLTIAHRYIQQHFPHLQNNIVLCGHSLGGAVAKLLILRAGLVHPCAAFNSPGVGNMPGVEDKWQQNIYNINSRYGLINKIGKTVGRCYFIDIKENEKNAIALFSAFVQYDKDKYEHALQQVKRENATAEQTSHAKDAEIAALKDALYRAENVRRKNANTFTVYASKARAYWKLYHTIANQHSIVNMVHALLNNDQSTLSYTRLF